MLSTQVKRVAFYPTCSGKGPHFGHVAVLFANWLLAQQNHAEMVMLTSKGHNVPLSLVLKWLDQFDLLKLPDIMVWPVEERADEVLYVAVKEALLRPDVTPRIVPCPIHEGNTAYWLDLADGRSVWVLSNTNNPVPNAQSPREFSNAASLSLMIGRLYGITHMIRGVDLRNIVEGRTLRLCMELIPSACKPQVESIYLPTMCNHLGEKLSSSSWNDEGYSLTDLLGMYGRDCLLALAFSTIQPYRMRWKESEINLDWMVDNFDVDRIPNPDVPLVLREFNKREGLFQRVVFE